VLSVTFRVLTRQVNLSTIIALFRHNVFTNASESLLWSPTCLLLKSLSSFYLEDCAAAFNLTRFDITFTPVLVNSTAPPRDFSFADFAPSLQSLVQSLLSGPMRNAVNAEASRRIGSANDTCLPTYPIRPIVPVSGVASFRSNAMIDLLQFGFNDVIGVRGPLNVSFLLHMLTNGTRVVTRRFLIDLLGENATAFLTTNLVLPFPFSNQSVAVNVTDFSIRGLDTCDDVSLFDVEEKAPHMLDSVLSFSTLALDLTLSLSRQDASEAEQFLFRQNNFDDNSLGLSSGPDSRTLIDSSSLLSVSNASSVLVRISVNLTSLSLGTRLLLLVNSSQALRLFRSDLAQTLTGNGSCIKSILRAAYFKYVLIDFNLISSIVFSISLCFHFSPNPASLSSLASSQLSPF
jgi:hypothetical protein